MESRFHHDFGHVRVHADEQAADSARAVDAEAYTVGSQLVFAAGRYAPATSEGRRLLAHELAHTVQQGLAGVKQVQRQPRGPVAPGSQRLPPGEGEYTPKQYAAWLKAHPKRQYQIGGPWEPDYLYDRYKPKWFREHGYVYAGRGGSIPWYWFEVWISDSDGGKEFRVWRTTDTGATSPGAGPAGPGAGSAGPGTQKTPGTRGDFIDPGADREKLFGTVIAARENVDAGLAEGDAVLYADGTVEVFVHGTLQSWVFRPAPGGGYFVYKPDGARFDDKIWHIYPDAIPDPNTDAVD